MSKSTFFIALGVFALLYCGALGMGLSRSDSPPASADATSPSWVELLGRVTGRFAPRVPLDTVRCNGTAVSGLFQLRAQGRRPAGCLLNLPGADDEEQYLQAELSFAGTAVKRYQLMEFDPRQFPATRRPQGCKADSQLERGAQLRVTYIPHARDRIANAWSCWQELDANAAVGFAVSSNGGQLDLQLVCAGCGANEQTTDRLRMR